MKKLKRVLTLILALTMCLSLFGCGKKSGSGDDSQGKKPGVNTPDDQEHPDFVYVSSFMPISGEFTNSIEAGPYVNGRFLCSVYGMIADNTPEDVVPEWEGQYWEYGYKLLWVDLMGNVEYLENYTPMKAYDPEEDPTIRYSSANMQGIAVTADGTIYTLDNVFTSRYTGPTDVEMYSDEFYELGYNQYNEYKEEYFIRKLAEDGSELAIIDINEEIQKIIEENGYFYPYTFIIDAQNNLYLSGDGGILILDSDGKKLGMVSVTDVYINSLFIGPDGSAMAVYESYGGEKYSTYMAKIDTATGELLDAKEMSGNMYHVTTGGGDYDFYNTDGSNFFGYDIETGEKTKLFNWINVDISDRSGSVVILDDGRIVGFSANWDKNYEKCENELFVIEKKPYDQVPHKTELTYACQYLGYQARSAIIDFNKNNPEYRIVVNDYSEYNTDDDYRAGMTKLTTEILSGKIPDILELDSQMPIDRMEAKGLFADIYPLLDADSELSRDDIMPNVLNALERDGKLYQVVGSYGISTVIGNPKVVGDTPGWTVADFQAALAKMPEGCTPFEVYRVQSDILETCLAIEMENLIDWNTGKCYFDTQVFTDILEFVGNFKSEFNWDEYEGDDMSTSQRLAAGKQMLSTVYLYDFWDYQYNKAQYGNEITFIGMPTSSGVGNIMNFNNSSYAISAKCAYPDAAWSFVRTFLTEEYQTENYYAFCTNKKAFEKKLEEAMTPEYQKDDKGNFILDENGNRIEVSHGGIWVEGGGNVEIYALSQEEADQIMDLINNTTKTNNYNKDMVDVIIKDAEAYFVGDKTAEEVGRLLQSKMSILVNEQR